jgi:tRNA A-37 threonylcarbamoyl transferase component Bud32
VSIGAPSVAKFISVSKTFLKPLDDDCLLDGQLHPSIRERLNRVRELPLTCVANLIGVEKIDGAAQLVWEFVAGTPLEDLRGDEAVWKKWAREVILAVELLHSAGIVHGAIHERNVFVSERGDVRLTHVSPLLYTQVEYDSADTVEMLDALVSRDARDSALAKLLSAARQGAWSLGEVYARIAELDAQPPPPQAERPARRVNVGSIVAAVLVALVGLAIGLAVNWFAGGGAGGDRLAGT